MQYGEKRSVDQDCAIGVTEIQDANTLLFCVL